MDTSIETEILLDWVSGGSKGKIKPSDKYWGLYHLIGSRLYNQDFATAKKILAFDPNLINTHDHMWGSIVYHLMEWNCIDEEAVAFAMRYKPNLLLEDCVGNTPMKHIERIKNPALKAEIQALYAKQIKMAARGQEIVPYLPKSMYTANKTKQEKAKRPANEKTAQLNGGNDKLAKFLAKRAYGR